MQGAANGPVVPPRVLAAGIRIELTSDCTVSVGSSISSCVVQTKGRLGVVSVVDTTANTDKERRNGEGTAAAHSQPPELPIFHMSGKLFLACIFVMPYMPVKIHTTYITP